MTKLARAAGGGGAWLVLIVSATVGTMVFAVRTPEAETIARARAATEPLSLPFDADPARRFAPLSVNVVTELLGRQLALELLGRPRADPAVTLPVPPAETPRDGTDEPDDDRPPDEIIEPEELTANPVMRVSMSVDKSRARPGDTLTYVITVVNEGKGRANGVEIQSHVPEHTHLVAGWECGGDTVSVDDSTSPVGKTVCVSVPLQVETGSHEIMSGHGTMKPGQEVTTTFKVAVDADAPADQRIENHAHVRGDFRSVRSNVVATRIT